MSAHEPDVYLAEHIRTTLATDPRVHELGIQVRVASGRLVLTGAVPTPERRDAVGEIARRLAPDHEVHNAVSVTSCPEVEDVEHLP